MVEKKDPFDCKSIFTFQPDGCAECTYAATCFIHFGLSHCPDNIRIIFFFKLKRTLVVFLFVCLFIHFAGELVWNVFVN